MPFTALDYTKRLLECIDTPRALTCFLMLKFKEYDELARLEIKPEWYLDPEAYFYDAQATTILQKWEDLPSTIDRRGAAIKKFAECEALCRETNLRLRTSASTAEVEHVLHVAKSKIVRILGDAPSYDELPLRFGPGASTGVRGRDTSVYKKLTTGLECSFDMLAILPVLRRSAPGWRELDTEHVSSKKGSELMFVPKNAKTDRPICIEPCINGFVQLGIGAYLKHRLRRYGVDLRNQEINQELARLASERELATVDFSSASDTIAKQVIYTLVPEPWVELLESCRCSSFLFEGRAYPLAKFSSMGNGYTFELESLIFYAVAVSCCTVLRIHYVTGENLHVFGDDVILPREAFPLFEKVCSYLGFKINREKTYTDGSFFESCGKDYFNGVLVRPYHHKKHRSLRDVFRLTNVTLQLATRSGKQSFYRLHRWCIARIERRHRCYVPEGFEDYGLVAPFDVALPSLRRPKPRRGWEGYLFKGLGEGSAMVLPPRGGWPLSYVSYMAYMAPSGDDCKVVASKGYSLRGDPRPKWGWFTTWTWPFSLIWQH
jgi:hypothetical protein